MYRDDLKMACRSMLPALVAAGSLLVAGCNGEAEHPETPVDAGPTNTVVQPTPPPPTPPPTPPTPAPEATGPCDATTTLALQTAIEARAKKGEVPAGAKVEGVVTCERVAEGSSLNVALNLMPGRCYTIMVHTFPNVTEVEAYLRPNLGNNANPLLAPFAGTVFGQDAETGPAASIGGGKNCFKNPLAQGVGIPVPAMVEAKASKGGGPVAVQIYYR
jgi:hypothetical protein